MADHPAAATARIEVLWRPGCPYCSRLRAGLRRAGISTVEHDIWSDPAAAARVRAATGGTRPFRRSSSAVAPW
jgi:glutaredoxin